MAALGRKLPIAPNARLGSFNALTLAVWPGLAIFVTVIAFNVLGDGLQDARDPRAVARGRPTTYYRIWSASSANERGRPGLSVPARDYVGRGERQ